MEDNTRTHINLGSEQYALEEEQVNQKIFNECDKYKEYEVNELNCYLSKKSFDGYEKAYDFAVNEETNQRYRNEKWFAYIYDMASVYQEEKILGVEHKIYENVASLDDIIYLHNEIKFALWRIVYAEENPEIIIDVINKYSLSPSAIKTFVELSFERKSQIDMYMRLLNVFLEKDMRLYSLRILLELRKIYPGDESVLGTIAEMYAKENQIESARKYLDEVVNPGKITEAIKTKYGL